MQAQRGPIYQHPLIWTVLMSPATPQPSWKDSEPSLAWVLGLRPEVFERAGAAQISGAREGQAGRPGVAERPVVPLKPGNAGGGKGPQFKTNARRGEEPGDWAT